MHSLFYRHSTLDKQRICVKMQLKSSKKQLKWNVSVPKSNSNDRYAITCDVIAYHLVHFVSIWLINKCQSGIDFIFTSNILKFYENIRAQSSISRKNTKMKVKLCKVYTLKCQQGDEIYFRNNKICEFHTLERQTWEWMNMQAHSRWLHAIRKGVITEKKNVA